MVGKTSVGLGGSPGVGVGVGVGREGLDGGEGEVAVEHVQEEEPLAEVRPVDGHVHQGVAAELPGASTDRRECESGLEVRVGGDWRRKSLAVVQYAESRLG